MSKVSFKKRRDFLPLSKPTINAEEIKEVSNSLKSGWITTGPKVIEFEKRIKEYTGAKHCLAVNSGTAGLHTSLLSLGIGKGDEVITTPMTFAATVNVIEHTGAKPVFVDINFGTMNICEEEIESKITKRTKAIMPVHFAGQPCDMDMILSVAKKRGIFVIEDAAHAIGTEYKGKKIGSLKSDAAVFSFHPLKNITTGEGGAVVFSKKSIGEKISLLRFHGITSSAWKRYSQGGKAEYKLHMPGFKYNMLDIQAALGIHQIKKLDQFISRRKYLAEIYTKELKNCETVTLPEIVNYSCRHAWHLYIIKLNLEMLKISRMQFIEELKKLNIGTGIHFQPIHIQPYYQKKYGLRKSDYPTAAKVGERILSLPLFPLMKESDIKYVCNAIKYISKKFRR
ncbi:MAG: DegT/DnrJ/EryC1/StrS family aminotransferase [Candidatus Schekmanbacteria bacterium]|nr:MAG: DegT/DnrJ/EryC1/StrS family aminotransferase [Candidatus Schekmanbacteria bacterium]